MTTNTRRLLLRAGMLGAAGLGALGHQGALARGRRRSGAERLLLSESERSPVVVLVHGALADMAFWLPVIPLINDQFTVVSYTLYGHHSYQSARAPGPSGAASLQPAQYTLQQHAGDLLLLIEKLGQSKVHLVGHDIGSNIALRAAMLRPEAIGSLTLSNTSDLGFAFEDAAFRAAAREDREVIDEIDSGIAQNLPNRALLSFFKRYVGSDDTPLPHWAQIMYVQNAKTLPLLVRMYRDTEPIDGSLLDRLTVPMHLLSGASRRGSMRAVNDALAGRFERARHTLLPGGYLAPIAWPEEFCDAIRSVVDGAGPSRTAMRT